LAIRKRQPARRKGKAGIKLTVRQIESGSYTGSPDFITGFPQLAEAFELGDNEGVFTWGLGLNHQSCKRIFSLTGPGSKARLVLDVPY
jgi:hypothetical protein